MHRWVLRLRKGISIVDGDGWSRFVGNDGEAFDLDADRHSEIIQRTIDEGERGVAAGLGTDRLLSERPALGL